MLIRLAVSGLLCVVMLSAFDTTVACGAKLDNEKQQIVDRLLQQWENQKNDISTARVKLRIFRTGKDALRPLTSDDVGKLLSSIDVVRTDDEFIRIVTSVATGPFPNEIYWGEQQLIIDGVKVRDDTKSFTTLFDGSDEISRIDRGEFNEIQVGSGTGPTLGRQDLTSLRYLPVKQLTDHIIDAQKSSSDQIKLHIGFSTTPTIEIDTERSNGVVTRFVRKSAHGVVVEERIQRDLVTYPGNIVFPNVCVRATYNLSDSKIPPTLSTFSLSVVQQAEFNQDISDKDFTITSEKPVLIRDFRGETPRSFHGPPAPEDVKRLLELDSAEGGAANESQSGRNWLIVLNGIVCLGLGLWMFYRRKYQRLAA